MGLLSVGNSLKMSLLEELEVFLLILEGVIFNEPKLPFSFNF